MELLIDIDRSGGREPLHVQLERALREGIRAGRLLPETRLPASRTLADELGISRGRVVEAYAQLAAEGYVVARRGSCTRVAAVPTAPAGREDQPTQAEVEIDLRPGTPSLAHFPRSAWTRALRRVLQRAPDAALASYDARGAADLRIALARYLNRARGTVADPARMVVCSGAMQGITLLGRALRARGARRVAVEDPGYPLHRAALEQAGLEPVGVPVDEDGLDVSMLWKLHVDAVLITPAHQFPTGVALSPRRRSALADWARERDTLVVEDDYDGEFRYDRQPVGTLQGLAPEQVAYLGSASKWLAPGLRLGWLVLPDSLVGPVAQEKALDDMGSEVFGQLALADLLEDTVLDRHLRRMRRVYQARRNALTRALHRALPGAEVRGIAAGLQALVVLPPDVDELRVIALARTLGIGLTGLSEYRLSAPQPRGALVVGYANVPEATIERAVPELARSVELARAQPRGVRQVGEARIR